MKITEALRFAGKEMLMWAGAGALATSACWAGLNLYGRGTPSVATLDPELQGMEARVSIGAAEFSAVGGLAYALYMLRKKKAAPQP